jgi:hypothetical protein
MSPLSREVVGAGTAGLAAKARPWEISPASFFEGSEVLRGLYGEILRVDGEGIALVPSVSYGMATARGEPAARRRIERGSAGGGVSLERAHVAKEGPARRAPRSVPSRAPRTGTGRALSRPRSTRRRRSCARVTCTGCAVACSTSHASRARPRPSARRWCSISRSRSPSSTPDITACDPDFVVAAGHKWLMGPYSLGLLYVAPRHRSGAPLEEGWIVREASHDFARLVDYRDEYLPGRPSLRRR